MLYYDRNQFCELNGEPLLPLWLLPRALLKLYFKYLTKDVISLLKYWLELFCNITEFVRSLAKIFEQFINIEQMFLFTALFVTEGDNFSRHN